MLIAHDGAWASCALAHSALGLTSGLPLASPRLFPSFLPCRVLTCQFPSSILPNELVSEVGRGRAVDRTRTAASAAADRLSSSLYLADAVSVNGQ